MIGWQKYNNVNVICLQNIYEVLQLMHIVLIDSMIIGSDWVYERTDFFNSSLEGFTSFAG